MLIVTLPVQPPVSIDHINQPLITDLTTNSKNENLTSNDNLQDSCNSSNNEHSPDAVRNNFVQNGINTSPHQQLSMHVDGMSGEVIDMLDMENVEFDTSVLKSESYYTFLKYIFYPNMVLNFNNFADHIVSLQMFFLLYF